MSHLATSSRASRGLKFGSMIVLWALATLVCGRWWGVPFWNSPVGGVLVLPAVVLLGPFMLLTVSTLSSTDLLWFGLLSLLYAFLGYFSVYGETKQIRVMMRIVFGMVWVGAGLFAGVTLAIMSV